MGMLAALRYRNPNFTLWRLSVSVGSPLRLMFTHRCWWKGVVSKELDVWLLTMESHKPGT